MTMLVAHWSNAISERLHIIYEAKKQLTQAVYCAFYLAAMRIVCNNHVEGKARK